MTENNLEMINLVEYEANDKDKMTCPKCENDTALKKNYTVDVPKAFGFVLFLGASCAVIVLINAIVMLREKMKMNKLPENVRSKVTQQNKMSLLGLHVPTKTRLECSKCGYKFFENYDTGDFIVVFIFFILIFVIVLLLVFFLVKFR